MIISPSQTSTQIAFRHVSAFNTSTSQPIDFDNNERKTFFRYQIIVGEEFHLRQINLEIVTSVTGSAVAISAFRAGKVCAMAIFFFVWWFNYVKDQNNEDEDEDEAEEGNGEVRLMACWKVELAWVVAISGQLLPQTSDTEWPICLMR